VGVEVHEAPHQSPDRVDDSTSKDIVSSTSGHASSKYAVADRVAECYREDQDVCCDNVGSWIECGNNDE